MHMQTCDTHDTAGGTLLLLLLPPPPSMLTLKAVLCRCTGTASGVRLMTSQYCVVLSGTDIDTCFGGGGAL
jgi:hypothetical protein